METLIMESVSTSKVFFWDINYILTEFFEAEDLENNRNLIYGSVKIKDMNNVDESHYAYSDSKDTERLSNTIRKYTKEKFETCLDLAVTDKTQ